MRAWELFVASLIACAPLVCGATDAARPLGTERHDSALGAWELRVSRDRFSASVRCRLRSSDHHAIFRSDAVGFRFKRKNDVDGAVYRLDGAAPRRWRDDLPVLIRLGAPIDSGAMANPTEGIVWIPYSVLRGINSVTIVARDGHRPRRFRLAGLAGLLAAADARGCARDAGFHE